MSTSSNTGQYLDIGEKHLQGDVSDIAPSRSPSPRRGFNESSPTQSDYDEETKTAISNGKIVFNAMNSKSGFNIRLLNPEDICIYYVDNSTFTPGKPDITVFKGADKNGQVVGVCKWSNMYSKTITIGIGDYHTNESGVVWDEMKRTKLLRTEFKWNFETPDGSSHSFIWKRAHKEDHQDKGVNTLSRKNYKLVEEATGQMVALFGSNRLKSWRKLGKFTLMADYGERWQFMVLLTGLALIEMSRRRSRARRQHGGGGS